MRSAPSCYSRGQCTTRGKSIAHIWHTVWHVSHLLFVCSGIFRCKPAGEPECCDVGRRPSSLPQVLLCDLPWHRKGTASPKCCQRILMYRKVFIVAISFACVLPWTAETYEYDSSHEQRSRRDALHRGIGAPKSVSLSSYQLTGHDLFFAMTKKRKKLFFTAKFSSPLLYRR